MNSIIKTLTALVIFVLGAAMISPLQAQNSSSEKPIITITEYSDYECPACAYFHPIVKKLKDKFGDQIEFDLKFFPLNSHRYSALAARSAQAAKNQGKFLEMHNLLFENQKRWSNSSNPAPIFVNYAKEIGLDMEQFRNELNTAETQKAVMSQKKEGRQAGVNSTPTFIIDGDIIKPLPKTYEEFESVIEREIKQKQS